MVYRDFIEKPLFNLILFGRISDDVGKDWDSNYRIVKNNEQRVILCLDEYTYKLNYRWCIDKNDDDNNYIIIDKKLEGKCSEISETELRELVKDSIDSFNHAYKLRIVDDKIRKINNMFDEGTENG